MEKGKHVLIVEDDSNIADLVEIHLKDLGYEVDRAEDGKTGLRLALSGDYSLIILDIMLPELDGLEVCKELRRRNNHTPVLMLTAKSEEIDKVLGLELGADDYLTKPFSIKELIARVKAIFRRMEMNRESTGEIAEEKLRFGELEIDLVKRRVLLSGKPVELTVKEFELLSLFAQKPGRAYSRSELLDIIWGYQFAGYEHTVNSHINRLRNKIEKNPSDPVFIQTVWGVGYRFAEKEEFEK